MNRGMTMKRNYGLDFLKFICSFLVVCIHIRFLEPINTIIIPIARIAVPVFFMVTGYFYSGTKSKKGEIKQIAKIVKLFVNANILYFVFVLGVTLYQRDSVSEMLKSKFNWETLGTFVFLNESPICGHLWYLAAIIYVLVIIYYFEKKWDRKKLYPLIPVLLLVDLIFGKYSLLIWKREFGGLFLRNFLFVGMPYFLIGDMLFRRNVKFKTRNLVLLVIFFVLTTLTERYLLGTLNLNAERDHYISTTFLAVFVFLLACSNANKNSNKIYKACCNIGCKLSLDIYILHPMLIGITHKALSIIGIDALLGVYNCVGPVIVFCVSAIASSIIVYLKSKIRVRTNKNMNARI